MEVALRELVLRRELVPARPVAERVRRRAITETPEHDAEVIVSARVAQVEREAEALGV
jgi:hypothetical protein